MFPKHSHSLGGIATAIKLRNNAIEKYYENPNLCLQCGSIIEVKEKKVSEIRIKKFCSHNCAAIYNNSKREIKIKIKTSKIKPIIPKYNYLIEITKKELFDKSKNWQSARTCIRSHADYIYKNEINSYVCKNCGYDKHIEICHIKPVSNFSDDSLIKDINDSNNLIGLCPNCHWEFDNGYLKLI